MTEDCLQELARLRAKADEVGRELAAPHPLVHMRQTVAEAGVLQARLHALCRRSPSIGVAGVFSTGKSLLLSLLLGVPELLAVSNVPTTGNVTRIRVRPATGHRTRLVRCSFTLLSPKAVGDMVRYMVDGVITAVEGNATYDVEPLRRHRFVDEARPAASDWTPLERFLRKHWPDPQLNSTVRLCGTELFAVRDAIRAAADLLPRTVPGPAYGVAAGVVEAALRIDDSRTPPGELPANDYQPPLSPADLATEENLRRLQPLIHEVVYDVEVDPAVWDFGMPVDLLDFPGLASSSLRDRYLAEAELAAATVLVINLDAEHPRNDDVHRLHGMLEHGRVARPELADSIVVVANRFDRVTPPDVPPPSFAAMAASSEDFRALEVEANVLTGHQLSRLSLTSALAGAAHVGHEVPGARRQDWGNINEAKDRWRPVAAALIAADGTHPLAPALSAFVADGGIAHTRRLLSTHIREHGLRIMTNEALAIEAALDEHLAVLRPTGSRPGMSEADRDSIAGLASELRLACQTYRDRLRGLRLLRELRHDHRPLDEAVLDHVARKIHGWDVWVPTVEVVTERATPRVRQGSFFGDLDLDDDLPAVGTVAESTADLLELYRDHRERLLEDVTGFLHDALDAKSAELLAERQLTRVADGMRASSSARTLLQERMTVVDTPSRIAKRMRFVEKLLDPGMFVEISAVAEREVGRWPAEVVPLHANRALPWHPEVRDQGPAGYAEFAEPMIVYRLRRDLVAAMHRELCRYLQDVLDAVRHRALEHVEVVLAKAIPTPGEVRRMVTDETGDHR